MQHAGSGVLKIAGPAGRINATDRKVLAFSRDMTAQPDLDARFFRVRRVAIGTMLAAIFVTGARWSRVAMAALVARYVVLYLIF